jgi:hypothetical protein
MSDFAFATLPLHQAFVMKLSDLAFGVILAAMLVGSVAPVHGQSVFVTVPQPHSSYHNQMIDFYAGGSSEGYTLRVSPQGGTLSINDYLSVSLVPWGYVTAQWSTGRIYIIFLVNVTETNFRIGFLYLTNSSNEAFTLRYFDYQNGGINSWTFQGAQHVFNRTVSVASIELPKLHIPTSATVTNQISALGPDLYLNSKTGVWVNGTKSLRVYPVLNQLFGGSDEYNEVWSLLTDDAGNYYFAILYMQNKDSSHVIIEHQLRLNNYQRLDGRRADARWVKGTFENQVTVRTKVPNAYVKIDGFPFQTNQYGIAAANVPSGIVTVEVPNEIYDSSNTKLQFHTWNKYGSSNPLRILVNSTLDVTAQYDQSYPLTVTSNYGNPQGSGWYPKGANATFSVQANLDYGNGTRRVFERWEDDSNSTNNQAWLIVDASKQVSAQWQTQYQVIVNAIGIPANSNVVAKLGNSQIKLNGSSPYTMWVAANDQLPIAVETTQIQNLNTNYYFAELRSDNQTLSGSLDVTKPVQVSLVYSESTKQTSSLSLKAFPSVAIPGMPLSISGSIDGLVAQDGVVDLQYRSANNDWQELATVPLGQNGAFTYSWQPSAPGNYSIKATWPGDSKYSSAAGVVDVRVLSSPVPMTGGLGDPTQMIQSGFESLKESPYMFTLIGFAASLMTLGSILVSFTGGPPVAGYFVGSIIVGFVFVFPISAALVVLRATKTRRRPSLIWLTPLLTIWLSSLMLVFLSPNLANLQGIALASEILLIASNVFAIPLLVSFRLAKLVA